MNIKDLCRIVLTYGEDGIRVASSLCDYSIKWVVRTTYDWD